MTFNLSRAGYPKVSLDEFPGQDSLPLCYDNVVWGRGIDGVDIRCWYTRSGV